MAWPSAHACAKVAILRVADLTIHRLSLVRLWSASAVAVALLVVNLRATYTQRLHEYVLVSRVHEAGQTVTYGQDLLDLPVLVYAGPDMGGLLLYEGDGKRIIELGLLSDPVLARSGYRGLDGRVRAEKPDLIETHGLWTGAVSRSVVVVEDYTPIHLARNTRPTMIYLIRNDLIDRVKQQVSIEQVSSQRYLHEIFQGAEIDRAFLARFKKVVLVSDQPLLEGATRPLNTLPASY